MLLPSQTLLPNQPNFGCRATSIVGGTARLFAILRSCCSFSSRFFRSISCSCLASDGCNSFFSLRPAKNKLDLSVGLALGSAARIALFLAPVLVLLSYMIGPAPMDLQFWPGAVTMTLIAAITACLVTNSGRSA